MCGVAGLFAYHYAAPGADRAELRAIRDRMAVRGPDGHGEWFSPDGRAALGHRRLAIIDLSENGAQPMQSADGSLVISFNGEIYNYRELRAELEREGRVMRSGSDTEVILHMYRRDGVGMLPKLRGMFAFCLWDVRKQAMLLARDPFGIKPLYVADDGWTARVASQVKALLESPRVSRAPELAGIAGFYLMGSVPEPFTLYQDIRSVPAGAYQWIDQAGPQPPKSYFDLASLWKRAESQPRLRAGEAASVTREALADAVAHHLVSDVPVGAFLSGGIDSGTLLAYMVRAGATGTRAITLRFAEFEGTDQDEGPPAAQTAARYGVEHHDSHVTEADFRRDLPSIMEAMDQPSIDGINTWFIARAARQAGLKVAISGLGGDELFGGYPAFRDIPNWVRLMWLPSRVPGLGALAEHVLGAFGPLGTAAHPKASAAVRLGGSTSGAYLLRRGLFLPSELEALLGKEAAREGLRRLQPVQAIGRALAVAPREWHSKIAVLEASQYMRNQLLRDADWAGMAHSLEIRVPLVDARLWERLALALLSTPPAQRKQLLAQSAPQSLPAEVVQRAKTGFATPVHRWQERLVAQPEPQPLESTVPWARTWGVRVIGTQTGAAA